MDQDSRRDREIPVRRVKIILIFLIILIIINMSRTKLFLMKAAQEQGESSCCAPACRVEAILTVDERGQMVLPKDIRERAGIQPGSKLALISWERDGAVCCISLIDAGRLVGTVRDVLSPMMRDLLEADQ